MFRELLESIRAEILERKAETVRTFETEAEIKTNEPKTAFEVSFEPALAAVQ